MSDNPFRLDKLKAALGGRPTVDAKDLARKGAKDAWGQDRQAAQADQSYGSYGYSDQSYVDKSYGNSQSVKPSYPDQNYGYYHNSFGSQSPPGVDGGYGGQLAEARPGLTKGGPSTKSHLETSRKFRKGRDVDASNKARDAEERHEAEMRDIKEELRQLLDTRSAAQDAFARVQTYLTSKGVMCPSGENAADQLIKFTDETLAKHEKQMADLKQSHQAEMDTLKFDTHAQQLQFEASAAAQTALTNAEVKRASKFYELKMEENCKRYQEEMKRQAADSEQRIDAEKAKLAEMTHRFDEETMSTAKKYEAEVAEEKSNTRRRAAMLEEQLKAVKQERSIEVGSLTDTFAKSKKVMEAAYEKKMAALQKTHDSELEKVVEDWEEDRAATTNRIEQLKRDLLALPADDFRPATDGAVQLRFEELQREVRVITHPRNLKLPAAAALPLAMDPNKFLARRGSQEMPWILQGLLWGVLIDFFFSVPLGFGFLGPGKGQSALLGMKDSWRQFSQPTGSSSATDSSGADLSMFDNDFEANKWRSAMFQTLVGIVPAKPRPLRKQDPEFVGFFMENCQRAEDSLREILVQATGDSGLRKHISIKEKLAPITYLAAKLALEFGTQRSRLQLTAASHRDRLMSATEFRDCRGGSLPQGKEVEVDLLVSPGLCKFGDGRGDMKARRVLTIGEIYLAETSPRGN